MKLLISHGASTRPRGKRADTPLIRAARFRRIDAVKYLLTRPHSEGPHKGGVELEHANRKGDTALLEAARAGAVGGGGERPRSRP